MSQLKSVFLSGLFISAILWVLLTTTPLPLAFALEIGLTLFGLTICLIYVYHFSQEYKSFSEKEHNAMQQLIRHIQQHYQDMPNDMFLAALEQTLGKCTCARKRITYLQLLKKDSSKLDEIINKVLQQHQESVVLFQLGLRLDSVANDTATSKHRQA